MPRAFRPRRGLTVARLPLDPAPGFDPQWTLMGYFALDRAIREALQARRPWWPPRATPRAAAGSEEPPTLMGYFALDGDIRRALEDRGAR